MALRLPKPARDRLFGFPRLLLLGLARPRSYYANLFRGRPFPPLAFGALSFVLLKALSATAWPQDWIAGSLTGRAIAGVFPAVEFLKLEAPAAAAVLLLLSAGIAAVCIRLFVSSSWRLSVGFAIGFCAGPVVLKNALDLLGAFVTPSASAYAVLLAASYLVLSALFVWHLRACFRAPWVRVLGCTALAAVLNCAVLDTLLLRRVSAQPVDDESGIPALAYGDVLVTESADTYRLAPCDLVVVRVGGVARLGRVLAMPGDLVALSGDTLAVDNVFIPLRPTRAVASTGFGALQVSMPVRRQALARCAFGVVGSMPGLRGPHLLGDREFLVLPDNRSGDPSGWGVVDAAAIERVVLGAAWPGGRVLSSTRN
jgi:hypothetical protein